MNFVYALSMTSISIGLLGLVIGSFVNALVWRLYASEELRSQSLDLRKNKTAKQKTNDQKLRAKDLSILQGRSMCVHCHHTLAWYDLLPVVSWLQLRGKCRYCREAISVQYPLVELAVAGLLAGSYVFWPLELFSAAQWAVFAVWAVVITLFAALALYDLKWMLLPNRLMYPLFVGAIGFTILRVVVHGDTSIIGSSVFGALLLGGFFYMLYQISEGKWIGGGDVRFGFVMGILLGWQQVILALAIASYIGTMIVLVLVILRKYRKNMRIPFGPLLILGTLISFFWGQSIIDWYLRLSGL